MSEGPLTESWAESGKRVAARVLGSAAAALGYDLLYRDYYSPIPGALPDDFWKQRHPMPGIVLDLEQEFAFLEQVLGRYVSEFIKPAGFELGNPTYGAVDAEVLYAMLRWSRPRRVVELGSGSSTIVVGAALAKNANGAVHEIYDPFPWSSSWLSETPEVSVIPRGATELQPPELRLVSGDVLFVDTTHTVKTGGDVNHILLRLVPELEEGVLVHFHDVFLPFEYPQKWVQARRLWAEQYLLHAFLAFNRDFEVLLAAHALARHDPDRLASVVPSFHDGIAPGAFWIRRRAAAPGISLSASDT